MKGLVIKNTGSWYTVRTEDGKDIESKIKGNFRLKGIRTTNPIAVGDYVQIETNQEGTAFITMLTPCTRLAFEHISFIVDSFQNVAWCENVAPYINI